MKQLETEIKRHNHILRQVWRDKDTAIYQYHGGYEAIVIKKAPAEFKFGKQYPERELYPGDEDWGVWAITRSSTDELEYLKHRAKELLATLPPRYKGGFLPVTGLKQGASERPNGQEEP